MKITSLVLAKKIADFISAKCSFNINEADVLAGVPELAGFDTLAAMVEEDYQAAQLSLREDPDAPGLQDVRDSYADAYRSAVGEDPDEPEAPEYDESTDEIDTEHAPDESEQ